MKNTALILLLLFLGLAGSAQTDSLKVENPAFTSMLVGRDNLYAIDREGRFFVWNLTTLEKEFECQDITINYTSLAQDKSNEVYLGTDSGKIFRLNKSDFSTKAFLELKKPLKISEIFFNSSNEIFLIVPYAIYDPINDKYWNDFKHAPNGMVVQKRFLFFFQKRTNTYFDMPQYSLIDSKDRIWMIKSFGEFGGSVQIFDTQKRKELNADIDSLDFGLLFPKSVFEDDQQNIYVTSGLQHFMNSGEIYKIENEFASLIYDSEDFRDTTDTNPFGGGIFVGPGTFNSQDGKIYFATTDGFYKADIPAKKGIKNPEFLFSPKLTWEREPLAIGVGMTIKELDFTQNNRLVFLTSNNGIGIYNGQKLIMLK